MAAPDYIICLNCETACYVFEWGEEGCKEALCSACGNDEPDQFITEDELDAIVDAPRGESGRGESSGQRGEGGRGKGGGQGGEGGRGSG